MISTNQLGLVVLLPIIMDMSAVLLWHVGRKESLRFFYLRRGRRLIKRTRRQRWWAARIWTISSFIVRLFFYTLTIAWLRGGL